MEAGVIIDIRAALDVLGPSWAFGGSVTDGTRQCWEEVDWEDARAKPTWEALVAAADVAAATRGEAAIRGHRDSLLAACDYRMMPDYPGTEQDKEAWAAYRQALRDITAASGFPWGGDVAAAPWPTIPA